MIFLGALTELRKLVAQISLDANSREVRCKTSSTVTSEGSYAIPILARSEYNE